MFGPTRRGGNTEILALLFDSQETLYAATGRGVFRSTDYGDHWTDYRTGLDKILIRSLIIDRKGTLFAGTGGRGLYQRRAGDKEWTRLTRGFEAERGILENFIRVLTLGGDGTIYAGTMDGGVYVSRDEGKSWRSLNQGLLNQSIRALHVDRDGVLYLGTGSGVFIRFPRDPQWRSINGVRNDLNIQSMVVDPQGQVYAGTSTGLYRGSASGNWALLTRQLFDEKKGL